MRALQRATTLCVSCDAANRALFLMLQNKLVCVFVYQKQKWFCVRGGDAFRQEMVILQAALQGLWTNLVHR